MKEDNKVAPFGGTLIKEDLPFPYVFYPWAGPWLEFRENNSSAPTFCECFRKAFNNYLLYQADILEHYEHSYNYNGRTIRTIINPNYFSNEFIQLIVNDKIETSAEKIYNAVTFKPKLCHLCNKKMPSLLYCIRMYGSLFTQTYGWYIKKYTYEFGLMYINENLKINKYIDRNLPKAFLDKINEYEDFITRNIPKARENIFYEINSDCVKCDLRTINHAINNMIENYVRDICGHKRIGEGWTSETLLSQLVEQIFPDYNIIRHYKHPVLKGLELDVFISNINVGIEYQGIQHFEPVEHWGGEVAFFELQERDKRKKELCERNNIKLIYINYYDELSIDNVSKILSCL